MRRFFPIFLLIGCPSDPPSRVVPVSIAPRDPALDHLMRVDVRSLDDAISSKQGAIILGRDLHDHLTAADGTAIAASWKGLIVALEDWQAVSGGEPVDPESFMHRAGIEIVETLEGHVRTVNQQLSRHGYWLAMQADFDSERAAWRLGFLAFEIEGQVEVRAGDERRATLDVHRLDGGRELQPYASAYGTVVDWMAAARTSLVLRDNLVRAVIRWLQVLICAPPRINTVSWNDDPRTRALKLVVATALRTELHAILGADAAAAHRIAELLAAREALLPAVEKTRDLLLPSELVERLPGPTRTEIREIEAALVALEAPRIVARCVAALIRNVRHHEIRHMLDYETRDRWLTLPRPIEAGVISEQVDQELSAYVAALASETIIPQFALWFPIMGSLEHRDLAIAEGYVGALMVEKLANQLGIASRGAVIHDGAVDLDRLVSLSFALASRSTAEIRRAAAAVWTELRGVPFVVLTSDA